MSVHTSSMCLKICFAASSGGHLEELLMLKPLMERYDSFIVTEGTPYRAAERATRCYYLLQVNRKEKSCILKIFINIILSLKICLKERPDVIVCTGALATIPICLLGKAFGKKLVFIESFANVNRPTMTGRFLYQFADRFYIQWQELEPYYPKALYRGGVY